MKIMVPLLIVFIGGMLMTFQYYIDIPLLNNIYKGVLDWHMVIAVFALVIAVKSLIERQWKNFRQKTEHPVYPLTTLISFFGVVLLGIFFGLKQGSPVNFIYNNFLVPLQATIFSLLAFYISSAAYRAFRAKNFSSTVLLIAAMIVVMGRIPLGDLIATWTTISISGKDFAILDFPGWTRWILTVPNVGIKRAFIFGITLGIVSTSLKVILGIERGWLK